MSKLESVVSEYKANGFSEALIVNLKALREEFKAAKDPKITKTLRFVYEYITENGDFDIELVEEEEDEEMEEMGGEDFPEPEEDQQPPFEFLLELLAKPNNKFNREDIDRFKVTLMELA